MIDIPDSIFPRDSAGRAICPKCQGLINDCACPSYDPNKPKTDQCTPRIRIDKSGRKGKIVTIIDGLPEDEGYLTELARKIKVKIGSGGTCYIHQGRGVIEIQGDQKNSVIQLLRLEKMQI